MIVYLVCIAKNENQYIQEWVCWYLSLGFDKIVICENNDPDGERIDLKDDRVEIVDYIGVDGVQSLAYTEQFLRLRDECDWIFFADCDEFLVLNNDSNIKDFLSRDCFTGADIVRINWRLYTGKDSGGSSVVERFKTEYREHEQNKFTKSFIRSDIPFSDKNKIYGHGCYNKDLIAVNDIGVRCMNIRSESCKRLEEVDYTNAALNHYPTKTIEEFVRQKLFRGGPNRNPKRYDNFNYWLKYNPLDEEELERGMKYAASYISEDAGEDYNKGMIN